MPTPRITVLSILALLSTAGAQELDQALLDKLAKEVLPVVQKETGVDLSGVQVQLADTAALAKLMTRELAATNKITGRSEASARVLARSISKMLLGKYDWTARRVLLCPPNFATQAKWMKQPVLDSTPVYRAVLIHELIHAADDKRYGWSKLYLASKTPQDLEIQNALIEGNAQRVTAKICRAQGWLEGFDAFTAVAGTTAPNLSAAQELILSTQLANTRSAYIDGRKFVEHVTAKAGADAVGKLFRKPPEDLESILHPEWYLDPKLRPTRLYNLEAPLDKLSGELREKWKLQRLSISTPQLRAALALLDPEDVDAVISSLKFNRMLVAREKGFVDRGMIIAGIYEYESPAAARRFVLASDQLARKKDEALKSGPVRILSAEYQSIDEKGVRGIIFDKRVQANSQKVHAVTLVAAKGSICVELMFSNHEIPFEDLKRHAHQLLAATSVLSAGTKPTTKPANQKGQPANKKGKK